jgi:hypothetical protein
MFFYEHSIHYSKVIQEDIKNHILSYSKKYTHLDISYEKNTS